MGMKVLLSIFVLCVSFGLVKNHGMMIEPPQRGSMWRYGFDTPKNYNDNGLNCGGFAEMMSKGGGKCAPCGDPIWGPRDHEAGGKFAVGVIARQYAIGQVINVTVELTSNHKGYFEFRLCPNNNPKVPVTQECLDQFPLEILGYGHRYVIKSDKTVMVDLKLALPAGLSCSQCIMQWKWRAAQHKGKDEKTGKECFGCGPQEYFINCADIAIGNEMVTPLPRPSTRMPKKTLQPIVRTTSPIREVTTKPEYPVKQAADPLAGMVDAMMGTQKVGGGYFDLVDPHTLFVDPGFHNIDLTPMEAALHSNLIQASPATAQTENLPYQDLMAPLSPGVPDSGFMNPPLDPTFNQALLMSPELGATAKPSIKPSTMTNMMAAAFMTTLTAAAVENSDNAYVECNEGLSQPTCTGNPHWGEGHNYNEYCSTMCPQGICPLSLCVCNCPKNNHANVGVKPSAAGKCSAIDSWDVTSNNYCSETCNTMNYGSDICPTELCLCDQLWGI